MAQAYSFHSFPWHPSQRLETRPDRPSRWPAHPDRGTLHIPIFSRQCYYRHNVSPPLGTYFLQFFFLCSSLWCFVLFCIFHAFPRMCKGAAATSSATSTWREACWWGCTRRASTGPPRCRRRPYQRLSWASTFSQGPRTAQERLLPTSYQYSRRLTPLQLLFKVALLFIHFSFFRTSLLRWEVFKKNFLPLSNLILALHTSHLTLGTSQHKSFMPPQLWSLCQRASWCCRPRKCARSWGSTWRCRWWRARAARASARMCSASTRPYTSSSLHREGYSTSLRRRSQN